MTSTVSWCVGEASSVASWRLDEAQTRELLIIFFENAAQELKDAGIWHPIPEERHAACSIVCDAKHALHWTLSNSDDFFSRVPVSDGSDQTFLPRHPRTLLIRLGMRKGGSGFVRWESPLVALQRAEGILAVHDAREADGNMLMWRIPPTTAQSVIASVIAWVSASDHNNIGAAGSEASHATASRDIIAYTSATSVLLAQVARVRDGGEFWTVEERLSKLSKLQQLAGPVLHKLEHGSEITDAERALLDALADGRAEFSVELATPANGSTESESELGRTTSSTNV